MSHRVFYLFWSIVILNALFDTTLQLQHDEAYYWTWSQNLAVSYYDHPPLVAYLIKLTTLFGRSEFYVRLSAVLCSTAGILLIYKLAQKAFNQRTAEISILLALAWPILQGNFFIITPDAPSLFFWIATLFASYVAIFEKRRHWWYLAGVLAGFGLLAKYNGILIFPSIFIFLLLSKEHRHLLQKKEPYIALLIAFLLFSPVIYWNYTHDWISFKMQFHHGISEKHLNASSILDYLSSQSAGTNPFIFFGLAYYIAKYWKKNITNDKLFFFLCPCLLVFAFFAYNALFKKQEGNWPVTAYASGIIFLAYYLDTYKKKWVYCCALGLMLAIYPFMKMPEILIPKFIFTKIKPFAAFFGNREVFLQIKPLLKTPATQLIACNYATASQAWYYLGRRTHIPGEISTAHNYYYWKPINNMKPSIFICDNNNATILAPYFKQVKYIGAYSYKNALVEHTLYAYEAM